MPTDPIREEARWRTLEEVAQLIDAMSEDATDVYAQYILRHTADRIRDLKKEPARHGA